MPGWATNMQSRTLYRVLALLLVLLAATLAVGHLGHLGHLELPTAARVSAAVIVGAGIGIVAALIPIGSALLLISAVKVWRHQ